VVHNLPQFRSKSEIERYRSTTYKYMTKVKDTDCRIDDKECEIMISWHRLKGDTVCVNHFFLGDKVCHPSRRMPS
jgi:hypothetical protein